MDQRQQQITQAQPAGEYVAGFVGCVAPARVQPGDGGQPQRARQRAANGYRVGRWLAGQALARQFYRPQQ